MTSLSQRKGQLMALCSERSSYFIDKSHSFIQSEYLKKAYCQVKPTRHNLLQFRPKYHCLVISIKCSIYGSHFFLIKKIQVMPPSPRLYIWKVVVQYHWGQTLVRNWFTKPKSVLILFDICIIVTKKNQIVNNFITKIFITLFCKIVS